MIRALVGTILAMAAFAVAAHDFHIGDVVIDHPYALPTAPGATNGEAYVRSLRNRGKGPDRLVEVRAEVATRVELQAVDRSKGLATAVSSIDVPAGASVRLRHDGPWRIALLGLAKPLRPGDTIRLELRFERGGARWVDVHVQSLRSHAH